MIITTSSVNVQRSGLSIGASPKLRVAEDEAGQLVKGGELSPADKGTTRARCAEC